MILFSYIIMRDLIRNYKMIIKGKNRDSDSECEPLTSSSSSSTSRSFGTIKERQIFKQESYSTESEDDRHGQEERRQKLGGTSPFSIQNPLKRQLFFPSSFTTEPEPTHFVITPIMYDSQLFQKLPPEPAFVSVENDILTDSMAGCENKKPHTHNSVVTIFAVWNTTMGSSLLAMSWGLEKTGLFPGILINILIAALCLYTAYSLLSVNQKHGMPGENIEVPDLCKMLIGKWAEILAKIFSLVVLIGANIVYWILMSNFLYNSVVFIYNFLTDTTRGEEDSVICPKHINLSLDNVVASTHSFSYLDATTFDKIWDLYRTVPIFLAVVMFPLLNFKSPTFFTKFNSLGTISVGYLLLFVAIKASSWGINLQNVTAEFYLKPSFCALTGMLSLSYFIHNIIISVMRHNEHQEHNGRDLSIAFGLITFTYIFIGVVFYVSFPLVKSCIEDNILNNFSKRDTLTIVARVLLLFQLFTVFPLISFMLRNDVLANFNTIFKDYRLGDFSYAKVIAINVAVLFVCIMFACFLPRIGTLIRYTGALSGLVYIFLLPSLLKIASLRKEGSLSVAKLVFHVIIIAIGVVNLFSQFFISDK